ncbi:MAG: ABC transporter permease [Bacteroidota bacterium]
MQHWDIGVTSEDVSVTNAIMGENFAHDISGIENYVRINGRPVTVKQGNDIFTENPLCVDNSFFNIFSFDVVRGDRKRMLNDMYSVVLSETAAEKYFNTTNVIGKTMLIKLADNFETFQVTGVMADMPINSSIRTDILLTMQYDQKYNDNVDWVGGSLNTFLMLAPGTDRLNVEKECSKNMTSIQRPSSKS